MDSDKSKETAKEDKGGGAVDIPPPSAAAAVCGGKNEKDLDYERERKGKESEGVVEGVPHQQVPQPGDFSTEALENL